MLILFYFSSAFNCRHLLQAYHVIQGNTCREKSHVQVLSMWFPQHLGHVSRTIGQPAGSLRWPLLCGREHFEQSVCLMCGFFFFDKPKHVHSCRQQYRPTGCFKTLKNLTRQEPHYCSQDSSMQSMTPEVFPLSDLLEEWHKMCSPGKYIIQKRIYLNYRLQCD